MMSYQCSPSQHNMCVYKYTITLIEILTLLILTNSGSLTLNPNVSLLLCINYATVNKGTADDIRL